MDGTRYVPIQIMDVAGLVPGASEGQGLGNQFLDDLRHAHALIHVVDVSGTTDQNGKETQGYDPINDINWLRGEIHSWITNNLMKRWGSIVRRHVALSKYFEEEINHDRFMILIHVLSTIEANPVDTLQTQFSGMFAERNIV